MESQRSEGRWKVLRGGWAKRPRSRIGGHDGKLRLRRPRTISSIEGRHVKHRVVHPERKRSKSTRRRHLRRIEPPLRRWRRDLSRQLSNVTAVEIRSLLDSCRGLFRPLMGVDPDG